MADQTIRGAIVAVLLKIEANEGVDALPVGNLDAVPVEIGSVRTNSPYTTEASSEATGSSVASAPLIVGQPATIGFRSRMKGAGPSIVYSATVKPPLHAALQACGKRGVFTAAIVAALATAGSATTVTLPAGYPATADAILGMPLSIVAGTGAGAKPLVIDYSAARVALLGDSFTPPLDTTSSVALPANWTYTGTSPKDAAARVTDQPSATIYVYRDGKLKKFTGCRGSVNLSGETAKPGFAEFSYTGVYAGEVDAAMPLNLTVAQHAAPVLAQGSAISPAVLLNRKPLPISTWLWSNAGEVESPADPNTPQGFGSGQLADRAPTLALDPLATLIAARNIIADIGAGSTYSAVLRHGSVAGNSWALTAPLAQPISSEDGDRGKLVSEQITLQLLNSGVDAFTRDSEAVLAFF